MAKKTDLTYMQRQAHRAIVDTLALIHHVYPTEPILWIISVGHPTDSSGRAGSVTKVEAEVWLENDKELSLQVTMALRSRYKQLDDRGKYLVANYSWPDELWAKCTSTGDIKLFTRSWRQEGLEPLEPHVTDLYRLFAGLS